ncbi:MAG TPA: hypothetical protein H9717_07265 [Candidatus Eisenbergiella merdipullorum]|uniref:Uncharacterized protein n=1 Tax=Candidatus Eisenbergiella merdipullorum TaxID=2838553 RepID=A0A9D2I6D0_9FIRM|nr:hypothetical protein [Candidatus Eisenbergiella merdipullorum]
MEKKEIPFPPYIKSDTFHHINAAFKMQSFPRHLLRPHFVLSFHPTFCRQPVVVKAEGIKDPLTVGGVSTGKSPPSSP